MKKFLFCAALAMATASCGTERAKNQELRPQNAGPVATNIKLELINEAPADGTIAYGWDVSVEADNHEQYKIWLKTKNCQGIARLGEGAGGLEQKTATLFQSGAFHTRYLVVDPTKEASLTIQTDDGRGNVKTSSIGYYPGN